VSEPEQYERAAERWTERQYADARAYLAHRADLVIRLGPRLEANDLVLDLACGDGGLGDELVRRGMRYCGVDATPAMITEARGRLGDVATFEIGDLNDFEPDVPVDAVTCFRAIYYAHDRLAFFRRVATYARRKLVFDLNPRQYRTADVVRELHEAGFDRTTLRPFFVPQTMRLARPLEAVLRAAERSGPLASLALRFRFTYSVAAWREGGYRSGS
jgi:SAM-dependent methyltransferase